MKLVTTKQFALVAFLVIMAGKMLLLPALMVKTGGHSSYISMLIVILLEIFVLLLFMLTIKFAPNRTFYTLLNKGAGKTIGKIIALIMLIGMTFKMALLLSEIRIFFDINLTEWLSDWVAILPLCIFLFFVGVKTLRGIGRLAEILVPIIVLSMVTLFVFMFKNVEFSALLPFLENGISPVFANVRLYPLWFADIPFMFIFLGQVKPEKRFMLKGLIAAGVGALAVLFFSGVLFMTYGDIPSLLDYGNNLSNMLMHASSDYVYGRLDLLVFSIWMLTVFIQLSLVFYAATRHLKYIFNTENNKAVSLSAAVILYIVMVILFTSEHNLHYFCTLLQVRLFTVFIQFAVPIFVFCVAVHLRIKEKGDGMLSGIRFKPAIGFKARKRRT